VLLAEAKFGSLERPGSNSFWARSLEARLQLAQANCLEPTGHVRLQLA